MLFLSDSKDPLVTGLFSEHQSDNTASSTRLEMLAQLSVKYLFGHLFEVKGELISSIILVSLVTDSQASNLIMDNLENITGPSTDISLGLGETPSWQEFLVWGTKDWLSSLGRKSLCVQTYNRQWPLKRILGGNN